MANFTALKAAILAALPENTEGEITATRLVSQLDAIIDALNGAKLDTAQDLEIYDGSGAENTYIKITEYDTGEDTATLDYEGVFVNAGSLGTAYHNGSIVIKDYDGEERYTLQLPRKSGTLAIASDFYTKSQVDTKLAGKLNTAEGLTVTDGGGETDSEVELQGHDGGSERITLTPEGMAVSDGSALGVTRTDYQLGNIHVQGEEPEDSYDLTLPTKNGTIATTGDVNAKYTKPSGGIPASDMASAVQTSLGLADSAYQKPSGGIPSTDLTTAVQTSLGKADTAVQGVGITTIRSISQADYESLGTYDASTLYVIV